MPRKKPPEPAPKRHERARGAGTAREVRPGTWRAWRSRRPHPETGLPYRPSLTFSGAGAEERAKRWALGEPEPDVMVLGDWLERWLILREPLVVPSTYRSYRRAIFKCLPLADRPIAALTVEDWQLLTNQLLGRMARSSVKVWRAIISGAVSAAVPRYLPSNPLLGVRLPREVERPVRAWRRDEMARLVEAARGKAHETWLWLSLGTGIRMGESRAVEWTDIDIEAKTLTVSKQLDQDTDEVGPPKNKRIRTVDLPDELIPVLQRHRARQRPSETRVCTSAHSGRVPRPSTLRVWMMRLCQSAGVRDLPPHSTRHTAASLMIEAGVPIPEVAAVLGHSSPAITMSIYAHFVNRGERRGAGTMGRLLAGTDGPAPQRISGAG
jgi:integrase